MMIYKQLHYLCNIRKQTCNIRNKDATSLKICVTRTYLMEMCGIIHLRKEMGNTLITLQSLNDNEEETHFELLPGRAFIRMFGRHFNDLMQIHEGKERPACHRESHRPL